MKEYLQQIRLQDLIALLGLIIASIALGWNILNEIRKTPRARVTAMVAKLVQKGNPRSGKDDYLAITIANTGERPMQISGIGCDGYKWWWHPFKKQSGVITPQQLPIYLKDGESHIEYFVYTPKQFKEFLDNNINSLYAWDSAGRHHRLSRFNMLKFKRTIRRYLKNSPQGKEDV